MSIYWSYRAVTIRNLQADSPITQPTDAPVYSGNEHSWIVLSLQRPPKCQTSLYVGKVLIESNTFSI